ncbi:hypothetical protein B0H17DRAFT_842215, partial [Mycena rosella]
MRGVPVEHIEWLRHRFAERTCRLAFDDLVSESFEVDGRLDQGDPHSGSLYLVYNSPLAEIPRATQGEASVVFVDNDTLITTGCSFKATHQKIRDMVQRAGGADEWADSHNALFSPPKYQLLD